jgi:2-iminobutanoate/2-iminopropanoate deaminase
VIERVFPEEGAPPQGPYSPAVRAGDFLFVSGQGPFDRAANQFSYGDIRHETRIVLENIRTILAACGATLADVVKCSVFLADGADFTAMNEVYAAFFGETKPARTTVACRFANPKMKVEIDCIAYRPRS